MTNTPSGLLYARSPVPVSTARNAGSGVRASASFMSFARILISEAAASSDAISRSSGQPPRAQSCARSTILVGASHGVNLPSKRPDRLAIPLESPDFDRTKESEAALDLRINDPRPIAIRTHGAKLH